MRRAGGTAAADKPVAGSNGVADISKDMNEKDNGEGILKPPYRLSCKIQGLAPVLFHRYSVEHVAAKAAADKGSAEKKTDNLESYVYRNDENLLCCPGVGVKGGMIDTGAFFQDPRSPRKSAKDLIKSSITIDPYLIPFTRDGRTIEAWEYEDTRRVMVQRSAVPRTRPGLNKGWELEFEIVVMLSGLMPEQFTRRVLEYTGLYNGLLDFRPEYGKFQVVRCERIDSPLLSGA